MITAPVTLHENTVIPAHVCLKFRYGGQIISETNTLEIKGKLETGRYQIFQVDTNDSKNNHV